jgi:hypothetical protein
MRTANVKRWRRHTNGFLSVLAFRRAFSSSSFLSFSFVDRPACGPIGSCKHPVDGTRGGTHALRSWRCYPRGRGLALSEHGASHRGCVDPGSAASPPAGQRGSLLAQFPVAPVAWSDVRVSRRVYNAATYCSRSASSLYLPSSG